MENLNKLKNKFFAIRHGESENNVQFVLCSVPDIGIVKYGLTNKGIQQATEAAQKFKSLLSNETNIEQKLLIVSSDFRRARETAEILHENLGVKQPIRFEHGIRERGLGDLEDYDMVDDMWAEDCIDPTHHKNGVESVMEMITRLSATVRSLDNEYTNRVIVLVSHGDPCQALDSMSCGVKPTELRTKLPFYLNCEIRELKIKPN